MTFFDFMGSQYFTNMLLLIGIWVLLGLCVEEDSDG